MKFATFLLLVIATLFSFLGLFSFYYIHETIDCREAYGNGYRYQPGYFINEPFCGYSEAQYEVDVERYGSDVKPRYPLP